MCEKSGSCGALQKCANGHPSLCPVPGNPFPALIAGVNMAYFVQKHRPYLGRPPADTANPFQIVASYWHSVRTLHASQTRAPPTPPMTNQITPSFPMAIKSWAPLPKGGAACSIAH